MSKLENKSNITTILHSLKTEYARVFKEKVPAEMEDVLIQAAREVKKRKRAEWYMDDKGNKKLRILERAPRVPRPPPRTKKG